LTSEFVGGGKEKTEGGKERKRRAPVLVNEPQ